MLEVSDGKIQGKGHWPERIAPNVILSAMNNLQNMCFGIAIGNGIAIAWWRKALKGATINDLHRSWAFGTSFANLVLSGRYFNFIALAALAAKLTIIDGVLLQRATTTEIQTDWDPNNINKNVRGYANETIPITGYVAPEMGESLNLLDTFSQHLLGWSLSGGQFPAGEWNDNDNFANCNGLCFLNVTGAGFEIDCNTTTTEVDFGEIAEQYRESLGSDDTANITGPVSDLFSVTFETDYRDGKQNYSD